MSDFVDDEVEEASHESSSSSDDDDIEDRLPTPSKKKTKKAIVDSSEDEDEEEDDEKIAEEMKDLINDEDEEEEEDKDSDDDDGEGGSSKRKHEGDDDESANEDLDEEDLKLLEENLGVKFAPKRKKLRRVKLIADEDSDKEDEQPEMARETIANELFDGDDGEAPPTQKIHADDDKYGDISGSEESDEDDFIVDDDDRPISKPRRRKGAKCNDEQLQQAQDLFGVEFDYEDATDFADDYYDEEQEEGYEEDEEGGEGEGRKRAPKKKGRKSIFEIYEPTELEKSHLTEADEEIRKVDIPERFNLRAIPVKETSDEREIEDEAEWIYTKAFNTNTLTRQLDGTLSPLCGVKEPSAIIKMRDALKFIRTNVYEVPFIMTYRREYVQPELNTDDLWAIYRWDERYCQLKLRKENMIKLVKNMLDYQIEQITQNPAFMAETTRIIAEVDIDRIDKVTSFEELNDCHLHFQLYYSHNVPDMKRELARKLREQKREERERRRQQRLENLNEDDPVPEDEEEDDDDDEEAFNKRFSSLKLAQRKDQYTMCKESGILGLARKYGLTADQLAENIRDQYTKHEVDQQEQRLPLEVAADFVCTRYPTPEQALMAARFMVAKEINCNPLIRKSIRSIFYERAVVNVRPTARGLKDGIDENHPCFSMKYLKEKPVSSFADDQFLRLLQAEQDGLIELKITIDLSRSGVVEPYINEIASLFKRDEFSDYVERWNEERFEALKMALERMIYPSMEKEMKNKMRQEALTAIGKRCGEKLRGWLTTAPYIPPSEVTDDDDFKIPEGSRPRVMGFAFAPGIEEACFAAIIDQDGEVMEYIRLPHFMLKSKNYASAAEQSLRDKDIAKLKNFINEKKPHVVALGAEGLETRRIFIDLRDILDTVSSEEQLPPIPLEIVDNDVARVYQTSRRANAEFKEYPGLLRQAISLARRLQDPLVEFSQLCSPDEEILCLKYHPLQEQVPKDELLDYLTCEFINAVNKVGVDVNRALVHPHTAPLVQFIAGFGPRKANAFLKSIKKLPQHVLESRTQLITGCSFGAKVFINCAGFIKIDTQAMNESSSDTYIEVLDSTRVHPEAYEWARKMAVDALEYDDEESNPAGAIDKILEEPGKLDDLDLDAFAEELDKQGFGNKQMTLYDIRAELSSRFHEVRTPYQPPNQDALFEMLTRETTETLRVGKLVHVTVIRTVRKPPTRDELDKAEPIRLEDNTFECPFCSTRAQELGEAWSHFDGQDCQGPAIGVSVRLDSGLSGFIPIDKLSDKDVVNPDTRVRPGMVITARIVKVNVDKFSVALTSKSSDLNGNHMLPEKDPSYYDYEADDLDEKKKKESKTQNRKIYHQRIIVHPNFQNIDFSRAEKMMSKLSQGEAIIRPSSKGPDHLTLTWKVHRGINHHVDIEEKGKDNDFSLGSQLIINGEVYEDLDEILARYVQPMAQYARDLVNYRYFRNAEGGKKELLNEYLQQAQKENPGKIHYCVSASKEKAGKFIISYLIRTKVMHEYIGLSPEGYFFRQKYFTSVNALIKWFKDHYLERPPPPQRIVTPHSMTPAFGERGITKTPTFAVTPAAPTPLSNFPRTTPSGYSPFPAYGAQRTPSYVTPQNQPGLRRDMMPPPSSVPSGRPSSRAGSDWGQMVGGWTEANSSAMGQYGRGGIPPRPSSRTPRTPMYATPGASSQMSISPAQSPFGRVGDQTPLEDEWS